MEAALARLLEVLEAVLSLGERLAAGPAHTGTRRPPRQGGNINSS